MHIKKNDKIIVLTGKDKGRTGKVSRAFPREDMVLIEGVNMKKKHAKARKGGQKGEIIEKAHPIHVSNVRKEE